MKKDLRDLTTEELGNLFPIVIAEPNAQWIALFEKEKVKLLNLLGEGRALRIEHFGSTAVPGLAAKLTIDILVEIPQSESVKAEIRNIMQGNDYDYILRTDSPPPYAMFVKGYTPEGFKGQCYHIHMAPKEHAGLWNRLYFRDYLISHPDTAGEYARLKKELAVKHHFNREDYTNAKKEFVDRITEIGKQDANASA